MAVVVLLPLLVELDDPTCVSSIAIEWHVFLE